MNRKSLILTALLASLAANSVLDACTRAVFEGDNNTVITGRNMDWREDMATNLWIFPKGIKRSGQAGPNSPEWVSKYGSLIASGYDIGTADGVNEKGLSMNVLYLSESDFGKAKKGEPTVAVSIWGQYILDNFKSVNDAVNSLKAKPLRIVNITLPNGAPASVHLSLSDSSGDSAILEYLKGELVIHHGKQYRVLTNSPTYDKQLAINEYWGDIGQENIMPGTKRAADRFVRASYYINTIPKNIDKRFINAVPQKNVTTQLISEVMSVMRSVSTPLGIVSKNDPNNSSTIWRTVFDHKNKVYYFDSATTPNTFWVSLNKINFTKGAPVMKLSLVNGQVFAGDASKQFIEAESFQFLNANA